MVTSLKNLKTEIDCRLLAGGLDSLSCCQLENAQCILDNCIVTSVSDRASLPCADLNDGRFIYVECDNEYFFSSLGEWVNDTSSTIKTVQKQLWAWGRNTYGQLGDGTLLTNSCSPVREICSATDWCQVSAGTFHTAAIKTSGQLWSWGRNFFGQLADGATTDRCSPVRERCSATDWCLVSAGSSHTVAIKTSGQLWAWGNNSYGRLGDGTTTSRCSPVRERCSATEWCQVSAGELHTAAIKTSGQLWVWGCNGGVQLGDGTTTDRCSPVREFCSATDWCQVSAGNGVGTGHTSAIKTSGQLWTWGGNDCGGRLGDGTTVNKCSPVREICSATDWCQVSAGYSHTAAIKTSGQLWAWGINSYGRLGDGTTVNKCSPVRERCSATDWCGVTGSIGHTVAIKTSGQIWAWGRNICGGLGDGTITSRCSPVRERCSATDWCQVWAGGCHTAAIKSTVKGFLE